MLKILNILIFLNISFILFSNEIQKLPDNTVNSTKINFSFSSYNNNNNFNLNLYAAKEKALIKSGPNIILLRTGIGLTAAGATALLLGGTLIGISHLFAWYSIADILGDTDFIVKDWVIVWKIVFFTFGYQYTTPAVLAMVIGNALCGLGSILIPGIVFIIYSLIQLRKEKQRKLDETEISFKITPLSDAVGISIRF